MSVRRLEPQLPMHSQGIKPRSPAEMLEPSRAPARPSGRRKRRETGSFGTFVRALSGILTLGLILMALAGGALLLVNHQFDSPGPLEADRMFAVPRGEGRIDIATRLERDGIITNRWTFILNHLVRIWHHGDRLDLKAGEYQIAAGASMREVMETLTSGKGVMLKITLPEGLTSQQIVERLMAEEALTGEIAAIPPEGSLLPDTYAFSRGMARQDLLDRMQAAQRRVIEQLWPERQPDLPISTPEEAIILASIVEKETALAAERGRVAGVFVNRLRKGMRLQSDPTIIYGIVGGRGSLGRPILRSDIQQKTTYNTYTIDGLPPTPICNPGRDAIAAVLKPEATKALYFVADGTGGHKFSETLAEHNAAVVKWRQIERAARREAAARAAAAAKQQQAQETPSAEPAGTQPASEIPVPGSTRAVVRTVPVRTVDGDVAPAATAPAPGSAGTVVTAGSATTAGGASPGAAARADEEGPATGPTSVPLPTRKPR